MANQDVCRVEDLGATVHGSYDYHVTAVGSNFLLGTRQETPCKGHDDTKEILTDLFEHGIQFPGSRVYGLPKAPKPYPAP